LSRGERQKALLVSGPYQAFILLEPYVTDRLSIGLPRTA
jgi:hypothetical protein